VLSKIIPGSAKAVALASPKLDLKERIAFLRPFTR
jgi:hypothetical protein